MNASKIWKAVRKEVRKVIAMKFGYVVDSYEYDGLHYCLTWKEAVEWMACYKKGSFLTVSRAGEIIAMRGELGSACN